MSRELLEKFVEQYKGWYIPKTIEEKNETFDIISSSAYSWAEAYPSLTPTIEASETCMYYKKEKYDELLDRKMVVIVKKIEDGLVIYCFKYSNGIDMYRLITHAMSPNIHTEVLQNPDYVDYLTMNLYKDMMKYTGKSVYLLWDMYSDKEYIERSKKYGITGYRNEKIGWVWIL